MNSTNENNVNISNLFILFGIIGLIISTIDILYIIFPLHISNPEWVFNITQNIISSFLAPALCIVILLVGFYIKESCSSAKNILIFEKLVSITSFLFGIVLCLFMLLYSLSIKAYETKVTSLIKQKSGEILKQIDVIYNEQKNQIPIDLYTKKVGEIKQKTSAQVSFTKKMLLIKNIKTMTESILYICLYLIIGIFSFKSAKNKLLKSKFSQ